MHEAENRPLDLGHDPQLESSAELSEADLECVVGGLARPWTEAEADEWLEPAPGLV
jgi:hypothetical protein